MSQSISGSHSFGRKLFLHIELLYRELASRIVPLHALKRGFYDGLETFNIIFAWFSIVSR
jgi:hypothetical protein